MKFLYGDSHISVSVTFSDLQFTDTYSFEVKSFRIGKKVMLCLAEH